ncbi:hypothetical protein ABZ297_24265 [Nonomuraea sp. NPDC005983]|uniref:hypothetical protein n=1 Tax=Nonomuraea sp. NPDC005983 TaxID=3155595 RepID=UPI0033AEA400
MDLYREATLRPRVRGERGVDGDGDGDGADDGCSAEGASFSSVVGSIIGLRDAHSPFTASTISRP